MRDFRFAPSPLTVDFAQIEDAFQYFHTQTGAPTARPDERYYQGQGVSYMEEPGRLARQGPNDEYKIAMDDRLNAQLAELEGARYE